MIFCLLVLLRAQEIKKENGITIIKNPMAPLTLQDSPSGLTLQEDLCIGKELGKLDYVFGSITSFKVDREGKIYVIDGKDSLIKIFDDEGKFLKSFGKSGQGPGEFLSPLDIYFIKDDKMLILEGRNNRFSYFSKLGDFIETISLGKYRLWNYLPNSENSIYGELPSLGKNPFMELMKFDKQMKPIKKISSFQINNVNNPPPFELYERFLFALGENDSLIWARNYNYQFDIVDRNGKTYQRIIKDFKPKKITKKYVKSELKKRYPKRKLNQNIKIPDHWPKHLPILLSIFYDDGENLFVQTSERDEKGCIFYDVFDKQGRYFTKFSHPDNELIKVIQNNKAYCLIKADDEGIPLIKRYKITWNQ